MNGDYQKMAEKIKGQIIVVSFDGNVLNLTVVNDEGTQANDINVFLNEWDKGLKNFVPSEEHVTRFDETVKEFLGDDLSHESSEDDFKALIGKELEYYVQGNKCSLYEIKSLAKPTADEIGELWTGSKVVEVRELDSVKIVVIEHEGKRYGIRYNFGTWIPSMNKSIPNPAEKEKARKRFEATYVGFKFDEASELVGHEITVEVEKNNVGNQATTPAFLSAKKYKK